MTDENHKRHQEPPSQKCSDPAHDTPKIITDLRRWCAQSRPRRPTRWLWATPSASHGPPEPGHTHARTHTYLIAKCKQIRNLHLFIILLNFLSSKCHKNCCYNDFLGPEGAESAKFEDTVFSAECAACRCEYTGDWQPAGLILEKLDLSSLVI